MVRLEQISEISPKSIDFTSDGKLSTLGSFEAEDAAFRLLKRSAVLGLWVGMAWSEYSEIAAQDLESYSDPQAILASGLNNLIERGLVKLTFSAGAAKTPEIIIWPTGALIKKIYERQQERVNAKKDS